MAPMSVQDALAILSDPACMIHWDDCWEFGRHVLIDAADQVLLVDALRQSSAEARWFALAVLRDNGTDWLPLKHDLARLVLDEDYFVQSRAVGITIRRLPREEAEAVLRPALRNLRQEFWVWCRVAFFFLR